MIVSKCPLRISLVGGSTDLQKYLDKYKGGCVVSFPANLYTYIILKEIRHGTEHTIVYSDVKEKVSNLKPELIKNDIARTVLSHFKDVPPVEITLTADIPSSGSGLASSSSYLINLIEAVTRFLNIKMSQYEICTLAIELERTFNPLTGYQDAYGCGIGGLKRMDFVSSGLDSIKFLDASGFRDMAMYLVPTNKTRSSTAILSTLDIDKIHALAQCAEYLSKFGTDSYSIYNAINFAWLKKKETSPEIVNSDIKDLETSVRIGGAKAVKLLGAGGGGYLLALYRQSIVSTALHTDIH